MRVKTIGWLLLLGALGVPAVLFYNWWSQMQSSTKYEVKQKQPSEGNAFGDVRSTPPNPIQAAAAVSTGAAAGAPAAKAGGAPAGAPGTAPAVPGGAPPAGGTAAGGAGAAPGGAPGLPPGGAARPAGTVRRVGGAASAATRAAGGAGTVRRLGGGRILQYASRSGRDPMLSVIDEQMLALEKDAKERARRDMLRKLQAQKEASKPKPKKKVDRCKQVEVQGIIALASGSSAIINDEVRKRGDTVLGCRIRKITSKFVVLRCGRKPCIKRVSR